MVRKGAPTRRIRRGGGREIVKKKKKVLSRPKYIGNINLIFVDDTELSVNVYRRAKTVWLGWGTQKHFVRPDNTGNISGWIRELIHVFGKGIRNYKFKSQMAMENVANNLLV